MSSRPSRGAARLAAILDALPDALVLVNANGTVVNANTIALEAFETPGTALVGRGLLDLLPQFDSRLIPGSMRRPDHMDPRGRTKPTRMIARRTDGTEFPVEVTSANLENGQQAYDGYGYSGDELLMLVVRDLTGTVDTEAELARSQRQTEMILRAASEGVVGTDTDGRIVLVNPAAAQILGYRAGELGGKELHDLVLHSRADGSPFPYAESPLADTLRSGRKHRVRGQVLWAKGDKKVPVDLTTAPVRDGDQLVGAVMTFTDRRPYDSVVDEKTAQEKTHADELERLSEEHASDLTALRQKHVTEVEELLERHAEELAAGEDRYAALGEREKDRYEALSGRHEQLLTLLAQSLRGPLDELRRELAALAADDAGQLWPEANQVLHHLSAGYSRITQLIDNVLGYQRLDAGSEDIHRTKVMLDAVVAAGVDGAVELIGPGRVQFAVHAPPIEAEVDPQRLAVALAHLVADVAGVDATGNAPVSAGGYMDNTVVVAAAQRGEVVRIEVRGPYAGGDPVHEPIVRGIVRAHGGVLQTHEVPGMSGSAFVLEVPIGGGAGAVPPPPGAELDLVPAADDTGAGGRRRARRSSVDAFLESDVPGEAGAEGEAPAAPTGRRRRRARREPDERQALQPALPSAPSEQAAGQAAEPVFDESQSGGRRRRALAAAAERAEQQQAGPRPVFALPPAAADRAPEPVRATEATEVAGDEGRHDAVAHDRSEDHTPPQPHPTDAPTGRRRRAVGRPPAENAPAAAAVPTVPAQATAPGPQPGQPQGVPVQPAQPQGVPAQTGAPAAQVVAPAGVPGVPAAGAPGAPGAAVPAQAAQTAQNQPQPQPPQPPAAAPVAPGQPAPAAGAAPVPAQPLPLPLPAEAAPVAPVPQQWPGADDAPAAQPARAAQPLPAEAAAPAPVDPDSTQGRAFSVRTLGQGVPFSRQAAQVQQPTPTPPPHQPGGNGRRRKLGTRPDPGAAEQPGTEQPARAAQSARPHLPAEQPVAAQPLPQPSPAGQSRLVGATEGGGRSYAIGAPDVNAAEGPEPLDGPGGAVEVADPPRPQPMDDELPPEPLDNPRRLLVWPAPDVTTQQELSDRGYRPVIVNSREEVDAQIAAFPAALFVDPLTGPITRTALQSLRQAAVAAEVPVMVTAGLGQATREAAYGADPAVLLKALAPRDSEQHPPRVLLIEEHAEIALALTSTLERRGMQVARAASDADAVTLAGQLRPNLVVMDLMQVHRRQAGIIDWLRANGQLNRTPLVVYTAAVDQADLPRLASGETVLFLAERSTSAEVQSRIVDLLARIGTN
ncbi:PAS domain-containing protein [Streptomyces sp. NPDC086777]|uniref:hybrid sensor histidine kinase/response regulator n=1 Tax=Streptomyces sp. NPDC086777 TaxID=3154866 RepID=UPI00344DA502